LKTSGVQNFREFTWNFEIFDLHSFQIFSPEKPVVRVEFSAEKKPNLTPRGLIMGGIERSIRWNYSCKIAGVDS
jgi:hypothetical protein